MSKVFGPLLLWALFMSAHPQEGEYIVIFELARSVEKGEPLLNLRVVTRAKSEGEAVMKATLYLQRTFGVNATETLIFMEVAPRKEKTP